MRSALRMLWKKSPERHAALKRAFVGLKMYLCEECRQPTKEPEVDHILPVGATPADDDWTGWAAWLQRLWCPPEALRILCHDCHLARRDKP